MSKPVVVPAKGFSLPDVGHFGHYFIGYFPDVSKKSETDQQSKVNMRFWKLAQRNLVWPPNEPEFYKNNR